MIADWLILLLIVPAVIAPVVLLFGFTGCAAILGFEEPILSVADPENLRAESIGFDQITLAWDYLDLPPEPVTFELKLIQPVTSVTTIAPGIVGRSFAHTTLQPGTTFLYQVRAVRTSDQFASDWTPDPPLLATTLEFQTAFDTTTNPNAPPGGVNAAGDCIVQRIPGTALLQGGSFVRITLVGLPNLTTQLDAVTISQPLRTPTPEPWDSADLPVPLTFAGSTVVSLQNGAAAVSDTIGYPVEAGRDLLIALDVNAASQNVLRRTVIGAQAYTRNKTAQATVQDRSAGFATINNVVHCIETIEIAGPDPPGPIT